MVSNPLLWSETKKGSLPQPQEKVKSDKNQLIHVLFIII